MSRVTCFACAASRLGRASAKHMIGCTVGAYRDSVTRVALAQLIAARAQRG